MLVTKFRRSSSSYVNRSLSSVLSLTGMLRILQAMPVESGQNASAVEACPREHAAWWVWVHTSKRMSETTVTIYQLASELQVKSI